MKGAAGQVEVWAPRGEAWAPWGVVVSVLEEGVGSEGEEVAVVESARLGAPFWVLGGIAEGRGLFSVGQESLEEGQSGGKNGKGNSKEMIYKNRGQNGEKERQQKQNWLHS